MRYILTYFASLNFNLSLQRTETPLPICDNIWYKHLIITLKLVPILQVPTFIY